MKSLHRAFRGVLAVVLVVLPLRALAVEVAKTEPKKTTPSAPGTATGPQNLPSVMAKIGEAAITRAEVEGVAAPALKQLEGEYKKARHQILENSLNELIQGRILAEESKARGAAGDKLLADGVKPLPVKDEDVESFYEKNKDRILIPKEQALPQVKTYLEQQRREDAKKAFYAALEKKYNVERSFGPMRVQIAPGAGAPSLGREDAAVTIVEFSDFQCPYCSQLSETLSQVVGRYGDKVKRVFRQYPLASHANAEKAAEASLCAHEQGKFWALHDVMFKDQNALGVDALKKKAKDLGLDEKAFSQCLDSGKHADAIKADLLAGNDAGVTSTPTAFVNGRILSGAVPIEQLTQMIDEELLNAESRVERAAAKSTN